MTADEMFEELGYKKEGLNTLYNDDKEIWIAFYSAPHAVVIDNSENFSINKISMEELKAIYKKCQELGWIE